jgi:hypothetical protein
MVESPEVLARRIHFFKKRKSTRTVTLNRRAITGVSAAAVFH